MIVNILGTDYEIIKQAKSENPRLEDNWGYTEPYSKKIMIECIDCNEHFLTGRYDSRTSPYCCKCQKVHDKEKAKERAKRKKQAEINEVLDKIRAELLEISEYDYIPTRNAMEILDKYRGKVNVK